MKPSTRLILLGRRAVVVSATLGSSYEPASAGSTVNKTSTWFPSPCLPVASILQWWECYATATGTVKLKLATPVKGGGWTVTDLQALTVSATGVSRFAVSANIPAFSLIGFHTPSSGGATISFSNSGAYVNRIGYLAGTGDLSGANVSLTFNNYGAEIQARAGVTFQRSALPGSYIIDEDFAGTATPAYAVNNATNAWSFATPGQTTCAATGLANFLDFFPTSNANAMTFAVEFEFTGASDRFAIYRKPILGGSSVDDGTIIEASCASNALVVYQTWGGSTTLPTARSTYTLTELTLATGVRYRLELTYAAKVITAKVIRVSDSVSGQVQVDNASSSLGGLCHGRPGMANLAGSATVKAAQLYAAVTNPRVLILGDSITGDTGAVTPAQLYSQLALNRLGGSGWYCSDGGVTSLEVLRMARHELRLAAPRYVVVLAGANDSASDVNRDAFIGYMQEVYDCITAAGATPVILMPTPYNDATRNARLDVMRAALVAKGWRLVRSDYATSVGGDGTTYDAAMFADSVHPNATGMTAIEARIASDYPEVYSAR